MSGSKLCALPRFQYEPLEAGHFRLLQVQSAVDSRILCEIKHFPVESPSQYEALSYVWGADEPDHEIVINESKFSVSKHLFQAIHAMSALHTRLGVPEMWIWIDAICINQDDLEEKVAQVPLMGDVYHKSENVCVWFGRLDGHALTALRIIEWCCASDIAEYSDSVELREALLHRSVHLERILAEGDIQKSHLEALLAAFRILKDSKDDEDPTKAFYDFETSALRERMWPTDHEIWLHLLAFLHHPWFFRLWTVQEIRLATNAYLLSEESFIEWKFFSDFRQQLCASQYLYILTSQEHRSMIRPDMFNRAESDLHRFSPWPELISEFGSSAVERRIEFPYLLEGICGLGAKERKDYIYGLMGLLSNEIRSEITIDYNESTATEKVFSQAVRAACRKPDGARAWPRLMEVYAAVPKELTALPSWVPDFSGSSLAQDDIISYHQSALSLTVLSQYRTFAHIAFSADCSIATVRGMYLDRIESVISTPPIFNDVDMLTVTRIAKRLASVADLNEDDVRVLFGNGVFQWIDEMDTMFPPTGTLQEDLPSWIGEFLMDDEIVTSNIRTVYNRLKSFLVLARTHNIRTVEEAQALATSYASQEELEEFFEAIISLYYSTGRSHVFRTVAGRLGFAPEPTSPGDEVCMIPGHGMYLHVLSTERKEYVTAGAFVEGFMGDKLLDTLPLDESKWQDFELR